MLNKETITLLNQKNNNPLYQAKPDTVISDVLVKASFAGADLESRKLFPNSKCALTISVGGKAHEAKRFAATIALINRKFKACDIIIGDTLHRYTIKLDFPEKDEEFLYNYAKGTGDAWIKRNASIYSQLTIPYNVIRWDTYLQHKDFQRKFAAVNRLYTQNSQYRDAFSLNAQQFLERFFKNCTNCRVSSELAFSYCMQYLKEECAAMCLWVEGGYNFEVYPSERVPTMQATYEMLIKPFYPDLLKPVMLRFKK